MAESRTKRTPLLLRLLTLLLTVPADMVGLYTSILLALWLLTSERIWFVNLFANALPGMLYPVPVALIVALLLRKRRTLILLVIPALAVAVLYGPRFLPSQPASQGTGQEMTALTYNVYVSNRNRDSIIRVLREADADVVALQEVHSVVADWLEADLSDIYPYQVRYDDPLNSVQIEGRMLLSRYPISDSQVVAGAERRALYIRAEIDVNGQAVTVYNVHLPRPSQNPRFSAAARSREMDFVFNDLVTEDMQASRLIVLGDFNMSDQTRDYRRLRARMTDVYRVAGRGLGTTFESFNAIPALRWIPAWVRLDYIFVSDPITPLDAQVIREGSSDHYPLWARLRIDG